MNNRWYKPATIRTRDGVEYVACPACEGTGKLTHLECEVVCDECDGSRRLTVKDRPVWTLRGEAER